METLTKAKQIGGSIGVIIPKEIVVEENIHPNDIIKIRVERCDDLNWLWGRYKDIKKPTQKIMDEIDEGEFDD